ncbi:MAG: Ig-like domain-containing protein [Gemmatimonadota bacterium]|nr:Ig-like domain-containing protein [Gemmatimonadota bacterium]
MPTHGARNKRHGVVLFMLTAITLGGCGETTGLGDVAPSSVSVTAPADDLEEGATLQLAAAVSPFGAPQGVTWATSDVTTALVDGSGLVTPVSLGVVTITATSTVDPSRSGSIDITITCRNLVQSMVENGGSVPGNVCYQALTPLSVNNGTLVVEPGAHISFGPSASLSIASGGRLSAIGTPDQPIIFTSLDPDGLWRGIRFDGSASADNRLESVVLANGGSSGWSGATYSTSALYLEGNSRVDVASSEITGSGGTALTVEEDVVLAFNANTVVDNAVAGWVHPNAARSIGSDNVFDGNADEVIRVGFGNTDAVGTAQRWLGIGVPFEIQDRMFVEAPLTLDPGALLSFKADVSMIVRNDGTLTAFGTAEAPITFTGTEPLAGFWKGLQITTVSTDNVFDGVVFEYGGSAAWTGDPDSRAMVYLTSNSKAAFTNSLFRESGHFALWVPAGGDITGLSGNVFQGNARTIVVHPNRVGAITDSNSFVDNGEQVVRVSFGNNDAVVAEQTWAALEVPYRVTVRTFIEAPLAIEAGTVVQFAQDASLNVRNGGSLTAEGTALDPIAFVGQESVAAYWQGIEFGTVSASNVLSYVLFEHAGSQAWFGGTDSVATLHITSDGLLDLADVTIRTTGGYALILASGGAVTCSNVDDGGFMFYDQASSSSSAICP